MTVLEEKSLIGHTLSSPTWDRVPLGDVCEFIRGVGFDKAEARALPADDHLPILRAGNIQYVLDIENDLIWVPSRNVSAAQRLQVRDIAICMSSGSAAVVGKTAPLKSPFSGSVGAFCGIIRVRPGTSADYVTQWFRSDGYTRWRDSQARGANIQNLRFSQLAELTIPLPPLPEQKRIAALLTQKLAAVDAARAAAEAQLAAAKALPATYLQAIFGGAEAGGWPKTRLGEVLALRKDIVHPRDFPTGETTFVGLEHVASGTGIRTGSLMVDMAQLTGRKPRFFRGDIVYGYLRPYLNKVWIAEFDGLCSVDQYVYEVAADRADTDFVAWFMLSPVYLRRAPIETTPGQLPRIRTEEVAAVELNLPPLAVQRKVVAKLNNQLRITGVMSLAVREQLADIGTMPAALLREAFSGRL